MRESQKRANAKWLAANYEQISFRAPKGTKAKIKKAAALRGMSMAAFIKAACKEKGKGGIKMKNYKVKNVEIDEYVGLRATVTIEGKDYEIAEQMVETEDGIKRGSADCYFFINGRENPNLSDALPVESEEEGEELYNSIIESMIELYEG